MTNNATKARAVHQAKVRSVLGIERVDRQDIWTSAAAAPSALEHCQVPPGSHVFVVGQAGLHTELREAGYITHGDELGLVTMAPEQAARAADVKAADLLPEVKAVVVGFDASVTYTKLAHAVAYIRRGAVFVATNRDVTFPAPDLLLPGGGTLVAAVEAGSGHAPNMVAGKPSVEFMELIAHSAPVPDLVSYMARDGAPAVCLETAPALFIGDRLDTDIAAAHAAGIPSILVLSGVTPAEHVHEDLPSTLQPTFVVDSVADLVELLGSSSA